MSKDLFTHLILKSFQGTLTKEEKFQLEEWLKEDSSRNDLVKQLQSAWKNSETYKSDFQVDLDKGWEAVQHKIKDVKEEAKIIPLWQRPAMRVAASVVLLLGLSWIIFSVLDNHSKDQVVLSTMENELKEVKLPDGSIVWLNENSQMVYNKSFEKRDIQLKGQAEFKVVHDPKNPFTVFASNTETKVLGTIFHVDVDDKEVMVSLIEGSVKFSSKEEDVILQPGETANYDLAEGVLLKSNHRTLNFDSWKTGKLRFQHTPISEVVNDLTEYFDTRIELNNQSTNQCLFTGTFENPTIDQVLEVLSFTFDLKESRNDKGIQIAIDDCK